MASGTWEAPSVYRQLLLLLLNSPQSYVLSPTPLLVAAPQPGTPPLPVTEGLLFLTEV